MRLTICTACLTKDATPRIAALDRAFQQSGLPVTVESKPCGEACPAPARIWLQTEGRASYVFEGIDLHADLGDIIATLRTYQASPKGWIEDARSCGRLRFCLTTRIPA